MRTLDAMNSCACGSDVGTSMRVQYHASPTRYEVQQKPQAACELAKQVLALIVRANLVHSVVCTLCLYSAMPIQLHTSRGMDARRLTMQ